jgi:serine protease AprX
MTRHIVLYFLLFFTTLLPAQVVDKVDIKLKDSQSDVPHRIVIVMKEQADISDVKYLKGKDTKATFVYNKLYAKAQESQSSLINWLKSENINFRTFYIVNMIAAKADYAAIKQIASREDVKEVIQDGSFEMLEMPEIDRVKSSNRLPIWNITHIGAPSVWAKGYTGQDVVIGGQDTGYAWEVNTIKSKYRGWNGTSADHNYNWHDAIHAIDVHNISLTAPNPCGLNSTIPCDDDNHGTHTMGTMVGNTDDMGKEIGVAPGAKWIGCRNMERGWGTLSTYVECFEWFLAPYPVSGGAGDPTKMPHVINNSWGCPTSEGCNTSNFGTMETALNNLRNAGCVIVVSAGNSGPNCNTVKDPAAIFSGSLSVGATNNVDNIASFSSRGTVTVDGSNRLKPNITAPGVDIRSCVANGTFANWPGTSMAGPHVAGLVALIISANPSLAGEVDEIEDIIEQTALNLTGTQTCDGIPGTAIPNTTFGYGRINALAAVDMVMPASYIPYIKQPSSIVISNHVNGLVIVSPNGNKFRINVNNAGVIISNAISNVAIGSIEFKNASLNMETSSSKIIFKSENNSYWQLDINNVGELSTLQIMTLPPHAQLATGDLFISAPLKGVLLRSPDNTCFLTNMGNSGLILTMPADCMN